jgi:hypothetical protein
MGDFQFYARISDTRTGERLPTFSVRLDPPAAGDVAFASTLARYSAEHYGRDALDVELDLQSALERIRGPRRGADVEEPDAATHPEPATPSGGTPAPNGVVTGGEVPEP